MKNPYTPPNLDVNGHARASSVYTLAWWFAAISVAGFALCTCFVVYLFVRYPMLEDTAAVTNKGWPLDALQFLAKILAVLALTCGIAVGVSLGLRRMILAEAEDEA